MREILQCRSKKVVMYLLLFLLLITLKAVSTVAKDIVLESFDDPRHTWKELNDPVMGGQSVGTFTVDNGVGVLDGEVKIVPFLSAPGFIQAETTLIDGEDGGPSSSSSFPDVSSCSALKLVLRTTTDSYTGFRVSFGLNRPPDAFRYIHGYKKSLNFSLPTTEFGEVIIPFGEFSDFWDAATGDTIYSCETHPEYCPDLDTLRDMKAIALWGEGVVGKARLEVKSISATNCSDDVDTTTTTTNNNIGSEENDVVESSVTDSRQAGDEIVIEDFEHPHFSWYAMNDPVMGGKSKGTVTVKDGVAHFNGQVVDVPFLHAPGFITMTTERGGIYPDVSSCSALQLRLRGGGATTTTTEEYHGYRFSFGHVHVPGGRYAFGYKTRFEAPPSNDDDWGTVTLPLSSFSSKWDDATGDIIVPCSADHRYCPDAETLRNMKTMAFWGEGVAGTVDLSIKSIRAVGCASSKNWKEDEDGDGEKQKTATIDMNMIDESSRFSALWILVVVVSFVTLFSALTNVHRRYRSGKYQQIESIPYSI